jgi:hypothetical protein
MVKTRLPRKLFANFPPKDPAHFLSSFDKVAVRLELNSRRPMQSAYRGVCGPKVDNSTYPHK